MANEKQKVATEFLEAKLLQAEKDGKAFMQKKREQKRFVNTLRCVVRAGGGSC